MEQQTQHTNKGQNLLKIKQVRDLDDLKSRLLTIGFYGAAGFLGYRFLLKPAIENMRKKREQGQMLSDPNRRQASVLYNAMNPSGVSWMRSMDTTNEKLIYDAARKITNWNAVQTAYRNLYSRDLLSDLQSELDSEEYQTLLRILAEGKSSNSNVSANSQSTLKGLLIAAKSNIRLRSTPDSSPGAFSLNTNILATASAGSFLGWSTGQVEVDNNGVKYLQVKIHFKEGVPPGALSQVNKKQKSKTLTFWVGAGAIYQFKYYQQMFDQGIKLYKGVYDLGLRKDFK